MAISDDFSVAANGDIRHTAGATVYTVLDLHSWLQDLADNASAGGNDLVSILTPNPSKLDGPRATNKPMLLNLLGSYNIDDSAAEYLNFGSIQQSGTDVLYTGVKSIGSPLVTGSPIYIVQNNAKLTSYWPNGHIQVLVKARTGGAWIDNGDIRAFSRKYGQTYADFAANLQAGGEQPAAISTSPTDWTPLTLVQAEALSSKVTITIGAVTKDTGAGGSHNYSGTIALSNGCTIAEAAQYCQAICDESSSTTVGAVEGWRFRALGSFTPNAAAPFGAVAGGKWFVAQGWWIEGALPADSQKYQMVADDGATVTNPVVMGITIGGLVAGDRILVGRDDGSGGFIDDEYTLNGAQNNQSTVVVREAIKTDTPTSGYIRVDGYPLAYTSFNAGTKTFTLTGVSGQSFSDNAPTWVPFLDKAAGGTSESTSNMVYGTDFTARVKVRQGGGGTPIQPFETTFNVTSAGGGTNALRNSDV